jgi:hypothetical protein
LDSYSNQIDRFVPVQRTKMFDSALPKEYGYVILVASSSALVATWHGINVFSISTLLVREMLMG